MIKVQIITLILLSTLACKPKNNDIATLSQKNMIVEDANFDFLLGSWQRADDTGERLTFEIWEKPNTNLYKGFGYTLMKHDTISQEFMNLELKDQGYQLSVNIIGIEPAVIFELDSIWSLRRGFTFSNPVNDFPQVIKYHLDQDTLRAEISGGGPTIPFTFYR